MDQESKSKIWTGNQSMELEISKKSQNFNAAELWVSDNLWVLFQTPWIREIQNSESSYF